MVARNLAVDLKTAERLILAGEFVVAGKDFPKPGDLLEITTPIILKNDAKYHKKFVSRAGRKLDQALEKFQIEVMDKICLDAGASTGGFTQCLLKRGARYVYAVDVGYGLIDWSLRKNEKVINIEKTNIRYFGKTELLAIITGKFPAEDPSQYLPKLVSLDLSFISLSKVLPKVLEYLPKNGELVCLIKPQFELEAHKVAEGGIVREEKYRLEAVEKIETLAQTLGLKNNGVIPSAVKGFTGNQEYFIYLTA